MADYALARLGSRDFEHVTQALAKQLIAPGVTPFGDGPDGGREASFTGRMAYPTTATPWDGHLYIQCKHKTRPSANAREDGRWALMRLREEIAKLKKRKGNRPNFYLFVTNVVLTPAPKTGSRDQMMKMLKASAKPLGLSGYDVWAYDDVCRFLDACSEIRTAYSPLILPGDVLEAALSNLCGRSPDFRQILLRFLQKELVYERAARLESAARKQEGQPVSLTSVFVDLPVTDNPESINRSAFHGYRPRDTQIIDLLVRAGHGSLRKTETDSGPDRSSRADSTSAGPTGRVVIVGGPGQGKSTLTQYLCQLHRVALLRGFSKAMVDDDVLNILNELVRRESSPKGLLPRSPRFPIRIVLNRYATDLTSDKTLTILEYIRRDLCRLGQAQCSIDDVRVWFEQYPSIVVFDGLDEVPASSNRSQVLNELENFRIDLASLNADAQIVCTTRPQSYANDFPQKLYQHWYLRSLKPSEALAYARRFVEVRAGRDEPLKEKILRRLELACRTEATAKLMESPLQVTIMAVLVERIGDPPRQRYRLFEQYYRTIYEREIGREGPLSAVLSERKTDIDTIHYRTGLLLQTESERAGRTEANLPDDRFLELVRARLNEVEVPDKEVSILLRKIADGSLERLVFLVRPTAGQVGFEIRSLQEFMAAEAILKGDDAAIAARLTALAPVAHWRNVFLFAAGKCFAELEHLLPTITVICESLNDHANNPLGDQTLWGSRLALDILAEGIANTNPKYERLVATTALKLVGKSDGETAWRLSQIYKESLADLYQKAISDRLDQSRPILRLGAWRVIRYLADRDVDWALALTNSSWPPSLDEQNQVICAPFSGPIKPWLENKLRALIPAVSPFWISSQTPLTDRSGGKSTEDWLDAALALFSGHIVHSTSTGARLRLRVKSPESVDLRFRSAPFRYPSLGSFAKLISLSRMPMRNGDWALFVAAARFGKEPIKANLAAQLRFVGEHWEGAKQYKQLQIGDWPFAMCVASAESAEDISRFASRAERGDFGNTDDWKLADRRWKRKGITEEDLRYMGDERLPYDRNIKQIGFPFLVSWLPEQVPSGVWETIAALVKDFDGQKLSGWLCDDLLRSASGPAADGVAACVHSIGLRKVLVNARRHSTYMPLDWLFSSSLAPKNESELREFIDLIATNSTYTMLKTKVPTILGALGKLIEEDLNRYKNLLPVVAQYQSLSTEPFIGRAALTATPFEDDQYQHAIHTILCTAFDVGPAELEPLADWYLQHERGQMLDGLLRKLQAMEGKDRIAERLAAIVEEKSYGSNDFMPVQARVAHSHLIRVLNSRHSPLESKIAWDSLHLPRL